VLHLQSRGSVSFPNLQGIGCWWLLAGFISVDLEVDIFDLTLCCNQICFLLARRKPFQRVSVSFVIASSQERGQVSQQHIVTLWAFGLPAKRGRF